MYIFLFFFTDSATTEIYTLSLHDALPILQGTLSSTVAGAKNITANVGSVTIAAQPSVTVRSEEHTSELQSRFDLVCRLLLEKKNLTTFIKNLREVLILICFLVVSVRLVMR